MNFRTHLTAVLHGQKTGRVPFSPYDNLVPRGDFERQWRNQGMGLLKRVDEVWSFTPGVRQEIITEADAVFSAETRIIYHTPAGSVATLWKGHVGRIDDRGEVQTEWLIKTPQDFAPVVYIPEARRAWGDETVIWVNFPETIFWSGAPETYRYTLDLLESDPCPERLVIGMTEMGTYGVTDAESEKFFKQGVSAIMAAIADFSGHGQSG